MGTKLSSSLSTAGFPENKILFRADFGVVTFTLVAKLYTTESHSHYLNTQTGVLK
jgi:hypothetical protein